MDNDVRRILSRMWHLKLIQFFIPSVVYCSIEFKRRIGHRLDIKAPKTFNEKMQWLKLYDHNPEYIKQVDKYTARAYLSDIVGEQYLVPLIGIYDSPADIPFESLPEEYVLKCTHDSGTVIIKNSRCLLTKTEIQDKLSNALKRNYYYEHREWPYKYIKPRIICEKYLVDESGVELKDYKVMCFNGKARCLFVCLNRGTSCGLNVDFYDMDWNPMPFERHYPRSGKIIAKPKHFNEMIDLAERLSANMVFLRVDFYESEGKLYIGELTLYPGSGYEEFRPEFNDLILGDWLDLTTLRHNANMEGIHKFNG